MSSSTLPAGRDVSPPNPLGSDRVRPESGSTRAPDPRRRSRRWLLPTAGLAFVLLAGALYILGASYFRPLAASVPGPEASPNKGTSASAGALKTVSPERVTLRRSSSQPASVRALYEAKVYARVPGYLKELKADIGDRVAAGGVLGVIDAPELGTKRELLKAEAGKWQAEESLAKVEVETAEAQVKVADAQVAQAQAEVKKAESRRDADRAELGRIEGASRSGSIDRGILNESQTRLQSGEAGLSAALAAVRFADAGRDYAKAKHRLAKATVESATAQRQIAARKIDEVDLWIGYTRLAAPFHGVVTSRGVDPGDLVGEQQKTSRPGPLFTIANIDRVRVLVHLPEPDAPWLNVGDEAEFRPDAFKGKVVKGTVTRSANELDAQTRTLAVEVELPNPDGKLLPGMYGQMTIVLEQRNDALVLPARAVTYNKAGKAHAFVVGAGGSVRDVEIVTGLDDGNRIEILRGLSEGERVVERPSAVRLR